MLKLGYVAYLGNREINELDTTLMLAIVKL